MTSRSPTILRADDFEFTTDAGYVQRLMTRAPRENLRVALKPGGLVVRRRSVPFCGNLLERALDLDVQRRDKDTIVRGRFVHRPAVPLIGAMALGIWLAVLSSFAATGLYGILLRIGPRQGYWMPGPGVYLALLACPAVLCGIWWIGRAVAERSESRMFDCIHRDYMPPAQENGRDSRW